MIIRFFLFISIIFSAIACENSPTSTPAKTTQETKTATPPPSSNTPTNTVQGKELYPSVPVELIQSLFEKCDYVDYSYNNLPFSMNRKEQRDIQHSLTQISSQPALINDNCQPLGRVLFYQNAEIALEAIIYYSQGCNYFVFVENNKPKYANYMTSTGVNFFKDILANFAKMQKQQ